MATFTCGCEVEELDRLPGTITIFYDRDPAGERGAEKLAKRLGSRARVAQVPAPPGESPKGWDISDALNSGIPLAELEKAAQQAKIQTCWHSSDYDQAMFEMERILSLEDPGQRLWDLAAFSKQTPFTHQLLQKIFTERQHTLNQFLPIDIQDAIAQDLPERQWLIGSHISLGIVVLLYADGGG